MATEIRVPALGESVTEATIGRWFKKVGDPIATDEPLVELETDKVTIEVPAPQAGTLIEITAQEGETVAVDALLGVLDASAGRTEKAESSAGNKAERNIEMSSGSQAETRAAKSGNIVEVKVPSAGESVTEAQVGEIYKKVGEAVTADEPLLELETDKAAQEVPSPVTGVVREVLVKSGDEVKIGALLLRIEEGAESQRPDAAAQSVGATATLREPEPKAADLPDKAGTTDRAPTSPAATKLMKEQGLTPSDVTGTGRDGQILKGDVLAAVERSMQAQPAAAPTTARAPSATEDQAREERVKMTRLRQTIARRLKDAQNAAAMLTTFNEVDMTAVMALRKKYKDLFEKKHQVKLGFMGFFTKAVCHALKEIPAVNAEIDGTDIIYKNYCHIGVAVGTDRGLVVPVVRDADRMSIAEVEKEIGRLGAAARDGKLSMADMQGGTFTISNGGVYGSLMSTPILNAPQSGILGMHKIQERPMVVGGEIVIRPMMYLALSYDHRIVDGKEAVTFLVRVKEVLEDPERLVLDL